MRIVATADFHIHPYRLSSRDGGHDRLMDGLSVLRQSLELARDHGAAWVFCGDFKVPKTFWPQQALTGAHQALRDFADDVNMVMLAGNHDAEGVGGSGLAPFKDVARVVESTEIVSLAGVDLRCLPWNARPEDLAETALPLFAHSYLRGAALGPDDTRVPGKGTELKQFGPFPFAVFGDIHKGQMLYDEGTTWLPYVECVEPEDDGGAIGLRPAAEWTGDDAFYCGSPYMQNWGERFDGPKGSLLIDVDAGTVALCEHRSPKFVHLDLDDEGLERLMPRVGELAGDFVRVVYTGKGSMLLGALRQREGEFRSLQVIHRKPDAEKRARTEIHAGMDRSEIVDRYMKARPPKTDFDRTREAMKRIFNP